MIVLDLEWNQPFGGRRMEEIIQIGAVRLARPGGPVVDAFNAHIRPSIYRKLSPVAKKLPESAQALTSELDFPAAYQAFLDWCGEDTLWAEWGAQDHGVLAANAAYWKLPAPPGTACIAREDVCCMGDEANDLSMLRAAGHGVHRPAGCLLPDAGDRPG